MMHNTLYVGVDPGKNGAVAVIWPDCEVTLYDLTGNPHDDASIFLAIMAANPHHVFAKNSTVWHVCIERTTAMPSDDDPATGKRRGMGATSAYNFGKVCGQLEGALAALQIPYTLVSPTKWRNAMFDSGGKGLTQKERKAASRALAMRLYPQVADQLKRVKDADRAEALLIARYLSRSL